jgi:hypothetical protein
MCILCVRDLIVTAAYVLAADLRSRPTSRKILGQAYFITASECVRLSLDIVMIDKLHPGSYFQCYGLSDPRGLLVPLNCNFFVAFPPS